MNSIRALIAACVICGAAAVTLMVYQNPIAYAFIGVLITLVFMLGYRISKTNRKQLHVNPLGELDQDFHATHAIEDSIVDETTAEHQIRDALIRDVGGWYATEHQRLEGERNALIITAQDAQRNSGNTPANRVVIRECAQSIASIDRQLEDLYTKLREYLLVEHQRALVLRTNFSNYDGRLVVLEAKGVNVESVRSFFNPFYQEVVSLAENSELSPKLITRVPELAKAATHIDQALREIEGEVDLLTDGPTQLSDSITTARAKLGTLSKAIKRCTDTYGATATARIAGTDTTAAQHLISAEQHNSQIGVVDLSRPRELWRNQLANLRAGLEYVNQAISLINDAGTFEQLLAQAKSRTPQVIDDAQHTLDDARTFVTTHTPGAAALSMDLQTASMKLADASRALKSANPDYLLAVELADSSRMAADRILETAKSEKQNADSARRDLTLKVNACSARLLQLESELAQHPSTYSRGLKKDVRTARATLDGFSQVPAHLKLQRIQNLLQTLKDLAAIMNGEYKDANK